MKKTLMIMLALVLVIAMSVTGTLAYLTSTTEVVTNTFTVGNVAITLDETDVNEYGVKDGDSRVTENTYKLIPGHEYVKDPIVHVTAGSEKCYLFVKVVNEITAIEAAGDTTIAAQMADNGWEKTTQENVYRYNTTVDALSAAQNVTVFDKFVVDDDADVSGFAGKTITIVACAVQADGLNETDALAQAKFA